MINSMSLYKSAISPIEEPDKVDEYRKQIGLGSIENVLKRFKFR
jgi:hypothetical protein